MQAKTGRTLSRGPAHLFRSRARFAPTPGGVGFSFVRREAGAGDANAMFDGEQGNAGAAGSESQASGTEAQGQQANQGGGEKGDDKEALKRMGEQRDAARAEAKKIQDERDALLKEKQEREAAEAKAKEEDAAKRGEFEALAKKREEERDAAKADVARLTADNDQYRAAMAEGIEAGWKALPEAVRKLGEKQHAEDDVLGRFRFLHDPDTTALVKQLTEKVGTTRGNGHDPKVSGTRGTVSSDEARAAQAPLYRRF